MKGKNMNISNDIKNMLKSSVLFHDKYTQQIRDGKKLPNWI